MYSFQNVLNSSEAARKGFRVGVGDEHKGSGTLFGNYKGNLIQSIQRTAAASLSITMETN